MAETGSAAERREQGKEAEKPWEIHTHTHTHTLHRDSSSGIIYSSRCSGHSSTELPVSFFPLTFLPALPACLLRGSL